MKIERGIVWVNYTTPRGEIFKKGVPDGHADLRLSTPVPIMQPLQRAISGILDSSCSQQQGVRGGEALQPGPPGADPNQLMPRDLRQQQQQVMSGAEALLPGPQGAEPNHLMPRDLRQNGYKRISELEARECLPPLKNAFCADLLQECFSVTGIHFTRHQGPESQMFDSLGIPR